MKAQVALAEDKMHDLLHTSPQPQGLTSCARAMRASAQGVLDARMCRASGATQAALGRRWGAARALPLRRSAPPGRRSGAVWAQLASRGAQAAHLPQSRAGCAAEAPKLL